MAQIHFDPDPDGDTLSTLTICAPADQIRGMVARTCAQIEADGGEVLEVLALVESGAAVTS